MVNVRIVSLVALLLISSTGVHAADALRSLSRKLEAALDNKKPVSLGVLNFPYVRGRTSTGSHLVSERLLTYLVQDGAPVIERRFIQKILEEKYLWECGMTDPQSMKKLATLLGVDAIVAGTLTDISDDSTEVIARIIRIDTAEIIAAASVVIPRLWADFPRVPRIAELSAPVPSVYPQIGGGMFQKIKTSPAPVTGKPARYRPAPVPGFTIPNGRQISGGRIQ